MQTRVALQWHHHQDLPPSSLLWQHLHSLCCYRSSDVPQAQSTVQSSAGVTTLQQWAGNMPLRQQAWAGNLLLGPGDRNACLWEVLGLPMRSIEFSGGISKNLMSSQLSRTPNHWIQWRYLWDMLWSVRKYKIIHVCIIKIQRRVITANDSIYWEIFKSVDCVMPTSYFCKAFDMVPHNSLVMKLDIWMNLMDSIDKKLAGWMHPKSYSQWFHVRIEIGNKWCPLGDGNCSKSLLLTLVVGLSSPLASFQRTPSSVMQQLRVGMLSRGMLTG